MESVVAEHGIVIREALRLYEDYMREQSAKMQASYDAISDDPDACARQDESWLTVAGIKHIAAGFREAADRAASATEAWEDLQELV